MSALPVFVVRGLRELGGELDAASVSSAQEGPRDVLAEGHLLAVHMVVVVVRRGGVASDEGRRCEEDCKGLHRLKERAPAAMKRVDRA